MEQSLPVHGRHRDAVPAALGRVDMLVTDVDRIHPASIAWQF